MAKKKSELIQLEVRHAIDRLVEDISEKMQEGDLSVPVGRAGPRCRFHLDADDGVSGG